MSWPLSQDYNEAIQSPTTNFTDPDLKRGEAVCNALGLPAPYSGNFADVYQMRCPDGGRWAVKCFTREALGLHERYQEISSHLKQAKLPFAVDFSYLEKGIRIGGKWYPILKMQWVEGLTLNQFIGQYLDKPAMLEALLQLWARMGKILRASDIAHCDLQHGNVLLVPGSTPGALALKLIDYDGMWVPALAGKKSGEVGHPSYQHPQRLREGTYSLEVDRFPLLLVATAMRALKADKALWAKYDNGDNLLFKEPDLREPGQSEVFQELASLPDAGLVMLAAHVRAALRGGLELAPLLEDAMPEVRPAPAPVKAPRPAAAASSAIQPAVAAAVTELAEAVDDGPAPAASSVIRKKKRKTRGKSKNAEIHLPMAAWIGGVVGILVMAMMVGGLAVWVLAGKSNRPAPFPPDNRVAQKDAGSLPPQEPKPEPNQNRDKDAVPPRSDRPADPGHSKPEPAPLEPQPASPDNSITNSIGMKLMPIPAGSFTMGSPQGEKDRIPTEGPQHEVTISRPFYMGVYAVTQGEYELLMHSDPSWFSKGGRGAIKVHDLDTSRFPVDNVTWTNAVAFCTALNQADAGKPAGWSYGLPTEAEWEYACRAGTKTAYFFGNSSEHLDEYAWYEGKSGDRTHEVGAKKPNPWGLYDMYGNVDQWCADGDRPYRDNPIVDPFGSNDGRGYAKRGGGWSGWPVACRSAFRSYAAPGSRANGSGFRVVLRHDGKTP